LATEPPLVFALSLQPKADYAALCHAAEKGSLPMVQLLLAKGANPYAFDDTGKFILRF
jgi:ankyrin repeat protein